MKGEPLQASRWRDIGFARRGRNQVLPSEEEPKSLLLGVPLGALLRQQGSRRIHYRFGRFRPLHLRHSLTPTPTENHRLEGKE